MKLIEKSALVAEIERLVNNQDSALDYEAALEDVRNFIDTLEVKYLQEEPVSKELEKAADIYGDELDNVLAVCDDNDDDNTIGEYAKEAFKAGAQWQKEQMTNSAKKSKIVITSGGILLSDLKIEDFDYADKVKLIIIKENNK